MSRLIKAVNKATGEVIELSAGTQEEIVSAWNIAREYEKAATALKDQLKKLVPEIVNTNGTSDEVNGYVFRVSNIQRKTYDKAMLRRLIKDEDFFDTLLIPDKTLIDKLLKGDQKKGIEPDPRLWSISSELRQSMVDSGKPYQVIKLEKLGRDK